MKVAIIGPNLPRGANPTGGAFVIHRHGCRDATRLINHPFVGEHGYWTIEATAKENIAYAIYSDHIEHDQSMDLADAVQDCHFCPCVDLPMSVGDYS